jgi:hypothetical protein
MITLRELAPLHQDQGVLANPSDWLEGAILNVIAFAPLPSGWHHAEANQVAYACIAGAIEGFQKLGIAQNQDSRRSGCGQVTRSANSS